MATARTHTLLDAALAYAAKGWQVFPCHTPLPDGCSCRKRQACSDTGKHPRTKNGLSDATTDEATIRRWWQMWPEANVAIRTGALSGLVVLDRDDYKGGADSLKELERTYSPLPETVLGLTGGGGQHFAFAHPGSHVKTGVDTLGPGLDTRADGGYIIAPPSLHKSGKRYVWEVVHDPEDMPLAPLPAWVLALCQEPPHQAVPSAGEAIPNHQRNDTLFRHGCGFRAKGCTEAVVLAALREMNATQCQPPLTDDEVQKIVGSIAKYEAGPGGEALSPHRNGDTPGPPQESPLPYSDYTNAVAFARDHGANLRYCYPWAAWLVWTGTHWQQDTSGEVMRLAKQTVKRLARQIETLDETPAKALMAHIKTSLSTAKLKAMIENAQSEKGIAVQPQDLDADKWLLNCANGTLDLRTGTRRDHQQSDLITKCLTAPYDPEAQCPTWDAFLWRIMGGSLGSDDPDMGVGELAHRQGADGRARALIAYLQRTAGYTLTGSTREQCLFVCHGPTKTGKSTYLAMLRHLLGPYGKQTDMQTFIHKDRPEVRNDLADLAGTRYVYAVESQEGKRLAEGLVKQMTGGVDHMKARFLYEELFEFRPEFKAYIGTNHAPQIHDADDAIWERIRRIPFTVQIPKEDRNKDLEDDLLKELPGMLAWAVRGCLAWLGAKDLKEPQAVIASTEGYRAEMDEVGRFLTEECVLGDSDIYKTQAARLVQAFHRFVGHTTTTARALNSALKERGYTSKRFTTGMFWLGIGLPAPEEPSQGK